MVFNANIFKCTRCEGYVLSEELESHQCREVQTQTVEGNLIWIDDGERRYPIKRTNGKSTTELNKYGQLKIQHNHICGSVESTVV